MRRAARTSERGREARAERGLRPSAVPSPAPPSVNAARVIEGVTRALEPVLLSSGCTLDRVEYRLAGRRGLLQVYIDKDGGVGIEDCANVSRQLSALLDHADVVPVAYTLEVSSPGLTRPLEGEADFARFAGRLASFQCRIPLRRGEYAVTGRLRGVESGHVLVAPEDGGPELRIPLAAVKKARLEIDETADGGRGAQEAGETR